MRKLYCATIDKRFHAFTRSLYKDTHVYVLSTLNSNELSGVHVSSNCTVQSLADMKLTFQLGNEVKTLRDFV